MFCSLKKILSYVNPPIGLDMRLPMNSGEREREREREREYL